MTTTATMIAGRYTPTGGTAAGGMGEIINCLDTHLQRNVVVKRLQAGVEARRILDEQKALAALRSKHVVQLFDIVEMNDRGAKETALVLEHISGKPLDIGTYKPDLGLVKVLWQIACGLRDIHAAGIVHRDIKPANVLMDAEGVVKIIDFGLARTSGPDAKTVSIVGTPVFMAPELWGGASISFDKAIDAYAFAVTALALVSPTPIPELAQRPPVALKPGSLTKTLSPLPAEVCQLLEACLNTVPAGRPTMSNVASLLALHLLRDKHRALVVMNGQHHHLNDKSRRIALNAPSVGTLAIEYDGLRFVITSCTGAVFVNNTAAAVGAAMPGCCVITFGTGNVRRFVTFDVSNPEVMP